MRRIITKPTKRDDRPLIREAWTVLASSASDDEALRAVDRVLTIAKQSAATRRFSPAQSLIVDAYLGSLSAMSRAFFVKFQAGVKVRDMATEMGVDADVVHRSLSDTYSELRIRLRGTR